MKLDTKLKMDGLRLLAQVPPRAASLVFFDPQYRAVLDELAYGNEGARQSARSKLPQMSDEKVAEFITAIEPALAPSGHLKLWVDKFTAAEAHWRNWFSSRSELVLVEMICWNKARMAMGARGRGYAEYLLVFQKPPKRAKGIWRDRGIPDAVTEKVPRGTHPHRKPVALQTRLILSNSRPGDLVVDPAAGGFGIFDICQKTGRRFFGCDLRGAG